MILLDLNQIAFATLYSQPRENINKELLIYIILNCIRSYNVKFRKEYGEMIIVSDGKNSWRKTIFPFYKQKRIKERQESQLNWTEIFSIFNKVKDDITEFFPYKLLQLETAEADDIIATICREQHLEKILIISGDTDFVQLHTDNISQFDPIKKRKIINTNKNYLQEHIIEGDSVDGIPNILSQDDTFVIKKKQKSLTKKKKQYLLNTPVTAYSEELKRNYYRNKELIDFTCLPESIKINIIELYESLPTKNKTKLFNYFIKNNLSKFVNKINEF